MGTKKEIENTLFSRISKGFCLIYSPDGTYLLFMENGYLMDSTKDDTPSEVYQKTDKGDNRLIPQVFDGVYGDDDLKAKYSPITRKLINVFDTMDLNSTNKYDYLMKLLRTLSEAEKSNGANTSNKNQMPDNILNQLSPQDRRTTEIENNGDKIENKIQSLTKPQLTEDEEIISDMVEKGIKSNGIQYINTILDKIHLGEHKNIIRKMLMALCVMRGEASFLSETVAQAEAGKSFEDEIVFKHMLPSEYLFEVNDMTYSAFSRYSMYGDDFFNRKIIYFGDFGSKKAYMKIEDVFDVVKMLITENRYSRSVSEATEDGYEPDELTLTVESIGAVYSTTLNSFTGGDSQLESRTLKSTPRETNIKEVLELRFRLFNPLSQQSKDRTEAIKELREVGIFFKNLINKEVNIINPYEEVFIDYAKGSESPIREMGQQLELFNSYCLITLNKCIMYKGEYIASIEQLMEYMNEINLENALIPYEYDFLKMIMAENKAYELRFGIDKNYSKELKEIKEKNREIDEYKDKIQDIQENTAFTPEETRQMIKKVRQEMQNAKIISMIEVENNAIESLNYQNVDDISDLSSKEIQDMVHRIYLMYGIRGRSERFRERLFFKIKDIGALYKNNKAYKNIDDISKLFYQLQKKGYIAKYEHKQGRENLYYLTDKCSQIEKEIEPEKDFNTYLKDYIEKTNIKFN